MAIEWRENLATGSAEIDAQHKELFKRFNDLLTACNQGKGKDEVANLLLFLNDYIRSHFAAEEELQVRHAYPSYGAHKEQHDKFRKDLRELERQFGDEGATVSLVIQTNQTLISWLIRHISGTDKELAAFLRIVR
jgi:hemerythrin